jgi:hypothetical protein
LAPWSGRAAFRGTKREIEGETAWTWRLSGQHRFDGESTNAPAQ